MGVESQRVGTVLTHIWGADILGFGAILLMKSVGFIISCIRSTLDC